MWDAGTPYLTIINDMLDYMGYFSLSCDPFGNYYALPYQTPKERPLKYRWEEGAEALFEPEITWTHDMYNVPNKVVYIVQAAGTVRWARRRNRSTPRLRTGRMARIRIWLAAGGLPR